MATCAQSVALAHVNTQIAMKKLSVVSLIFNSLIPKIYINYYMLGLKETIDRLATANGVRWYGHVLRRDDDSVLRVALNLEVSGKRKRGRPKKTWRKQVEEETEKIGLKKEDALRRDKWRDGVRAIAEEMG